MKNTFFKSPYLFIPVLFFVFLFLFDKIFGLMAVRRFTETRIEFSFYDEKKNLLNQLIRYNSARSKEDKLLVLFGTSHMGEFSTQYISKKVKGLTTYNFSAPMAPPSFLYYWFRKVHSEGIQMDYVVLEAIPEIFSESANSYALKFSYDWKFMLEHRDFFPLREFESFAVANLFHSTRFPFHGLTAIERIKSPGSTNQLEFLQSMVRLANVKNNGGIPNPILHEVPESYLERESKDYFKKTFSGYKTSTAQDKFFVEFLKFASENNIKVLVYKPLVSPYLQKILDSEKFYNDWKKDKFQVASKFQFSVLDLADREKEIQCKKFVDVHHLSGGCYNEITDILLDVIFPKQN